MKGSVILMAVVGIFVMDCIYAQENFVPGYIITLDGDSLKGQVDYRDWRITQKSVSFKTNSNSGQKDYFPIEIKGFGVQNEHFISEITDLEVSPTKAEELTTEITPNYRRDTVFLEVLYRGDKNLYLHVSDKSKLNFFIKNELGVEVLVYKKFINIQKGKHVISEYNKFIQQLKDYFPDCESISKSIKNTSYSEKSLNKLFTSYYKCTNKKSEFVKSRAKGRVDFGGIVGASITSLNFSGNGFKYLSEADFNVSTDGSVAIFFDFILPKNHGKWSFNNELMYTSYSATGLYENYINSNEYSRSKVEIGYSYLKLNNMLRFKYPIGGIHFYVNAGISNGIVLSEVNKRTQELKFYSDEIKKEGEAINNSRAFEQGLLLGLGAKIRKMSLEFRYEAGNGMSDYSALKSSANRVFFLFGYRLN